MTSNDEGVNRRSVLKKSAVVGGIGFTSTAGIASAESDEEQSVGTSKFKSAGVGEFEGSLTLNKSNSMSDEELEEYVRQEMNESSSGETIPPGVVNEVVDSSPINIQATSPDDPQKVTLEDTWDTGVKTINGSLGKLGETRHQVSVYKGDFKSAGGENVYILWHMSRADFGDVDANTKVEKMENYIDLPSDWSLYTYEPQDSVSEGGQDISVGIDVAQGPGTMSLGTTVTVGGGTVRTTNNTSTGSGSKYELEYEGCTKGDNGTEIINGLSLLTTSDSYISEYSLDWSYYTKLNSTLNCFW